MNDFKVMAKILSAVKQCELARNMQTELFDVKVLKTDESTRDSLIIKLQKEGYIDGFFIVDDIDNQTYPVIMWNASLPSITIKGMTFIEENKPLRKAIDALKNTVLGSAAEKVTKGLFLL